MYNPLYTLAAKLWGGSAKTTLPDGDPGNADKIRQAASMNRKGQGGGVFMTFTTESANNYSYAIRTKLINHHIQKWDYECDETFDWMYLENRLLLFGNVVIYKDGEDLRFSQFVPVEWNYDFNSPSIVKPIRITNLTKNGKETTKRGNNLIVNENCVVVYNDRGEPHHKQVSGKLSRFGDLITNLAWVKGLLYANVSVMQPKVFMDGNPDVNMLNEAEDALRRIDRVFVKFPMPKVTMDATYRPELKTSDRLLNFEDRIASLYFYHDRIQNDLYEAFGISNNVNPGKKERTTNAELDIDSTISDSQLRIELLMREQMCKDLKKVFKIKVKVKIHETEQQKEYTQQQDDDRGEINKEEYEHE